MALWWLTEFNSVPLPAGNFAFDGSRQFVVAQFVPTGQPFGAYNQNGSRNRMSQQAITWEFTYPNRCTLDTDYATLLTACLTEGSLKKRSASLGVRRVTASVQSISDVTTIDDIAAQIKRAQMQFTVEPFWYADSVKTVTFTTATSVPLNTTLKRNEGNARAIKNLLLTITTNITASVGSPFTITITPTYGTTATLQIISNLLQPIIIDAGAGTVTAVGVNSYDKTQRSSGQLPLLFLEGQSNQSGQLVANSATLTFSSAVSGNLAFRDTYV